MSEEVDRMIQEGALIDPDSRIGNHRIRLVTTDPTVAEKYGFVEESEYWDSDAVDANETPDNV